VAGKDRLTTNIARAMHGISPHIIDRQLQHFTKADPQYGRQVAEKLHSLQK
jgi:catalase